MKTKYFFSLATLVMLTSCTNNEEFETSVQNGKQKVEFADPFVGKGLTKASGDITTDGTEGKTSALASFKVKVWGQEINKPDASTAITVINGVASTIQSETPFYGGYDISHSTGAWTADKEFYYPRDKYTFRFAAFAPVEAINTAGESATPNGVVLSMGDNLTFTGDGSTNYGITNIPLVQEITNSETAESRKGWDLLVSNRVLSQPTYGATDRNPISFTFQHILSRLSFYVYTTSSANVTVKDIKAYLPKSGTGAGTACYNQNTNTDKPTAETRTISSNNYNSTNSSWESDKHDTWKWTSSAFTDITVSTPTAFKSSITDVISTTTYQEYVVFSNSSGHTVTQKSSFTDAIGTTSPLAKIGSEFFLAPTPTNETGTSNVAKYHFYVTVNYSVTEDGTTKDYSAVLPLYESEFYRFKQGWHHKLYLNLSSKKIRFISASVSEWDVNHDEDMTVSREVDGWTSEQN